MGEGYAGNCIDYATNLYPTAPGLYSVLFGMMVVIPVKMEMIAPSARMDLFN